MHGGVANLHTLALRKMSSMSALLAAAFLAGLLSAVGLLGAVFFGGGVSSAGGFGRLFGLTMSSIKRT